MKHLYGRVLEWWLNRRWVRCHEPSTLTQQAITARLAGYRKAQG